MNTWLKALIAVTLAVIIGLSGFVGGFVAGKLQTSPGLPGLDGKDGTVGDAVDEVKRLLDRQALNPTDEASATAGAIQGLLDATGDEYAVYFDERHFEYFTEESRGEFGGIGVVLGEKDGAAYVVEVYPDTPAAKAGIKAGDIFAGIDGVRRDKWASEEVVKRVRGEEGTKVKLDILRPGAEGEPGKEFSVTVERAAIQMPNVDAEIKGTVGYIRLAQFNQQAAEDVAAAIKDLSGKGAKSYVLDLRDNPGGLLSQAVAVSSLFIDSGVVVQVEERGKEPRKTSVNGDQVTDAPLVVLVNGNSASASEIVAGALQDHGRAKIVGEKTFGKGSVQTVQELSHGGGVKFTIAHYLTPKGRTIDGKGLTPDVVVEMDHSLQADAATDTQLTRALAEARKAR